MYSAVCGKPVFGIQKQLSQCAETLATEWGVFELRGRFFQTVCDWIHSTRWLVKKKKNRKINLMTILNYSSSSSSPSVLFWLFIAEPLVSFSKPLLPPSPTFFGHKLSSILKHRSPCRASLSPWAIRSTETQSTGPWRTVRREQKEPANCETYRDILW